MEPVIFSPEIDAMLKEQGFFYSPPAMGKSSTLDYIFGGEYQQRLRMCYDWETNSLFYNKPIIFKMNGGLSIGFNDVSEISRELIIELKKLCK